MRHANHVIGATAVSILIAACTGCAGWQSTLDPRSVQAESLMRLIATTIAVCAIVWTLVMVVLLRAVWRKRRTAGVGTAIDPGTERRMKLTISMAVCATVLVVIGLTVLSFYASRKVDDPDTLVVKVRGWQWWWEVTYPHAEPAQTLLTANEIHVPVGRAVRIELAAADVIHSFWVPNLAGKLDMIPGRDNALVFKATRAGVYRGQCAEFCGLQHAHMAFVVIAEDPVAFERWKSAQLAAARVPENAEAEAGRRVFLAKPCASCHTVRGTPAAGTLGPDLTHVGSRRTIAAGLFETTRGSLAAWIADPQTLKPGNNMPMVELTANELTAVAAYMATLQ